MAPDARCRLYLKLSVEGRNSDSNKIDVDMICQVSRC